MKAQQTTRPTMLVCEQAIFTSIRTPMGEGYRIIAASRGLRQDEKQAITRTSPSHDSLCWSPHDQEGAAEKLAAAFYILPTGRLCAALSRYAGEEHTGRGGHRVYTHHVAFEPDDFPACEFNPFVVLRAMVAAGLNEPQLKPAPVLPELNLALNGTPRDQEEGEESCETVAPDASGEAAELWGPFAGPWRRYVLHTVLEGRSIIVNLPDGWTERAEAILLGIPGPMRAAISFGAGLKYSVGRGHVLSLLVDPGGISKTRSAGRKVLFVDPAASGQPPETPSSEWLTFVERYWARGDIPGLSERTSRAFSACDSPAREQIGRLYNQIDTLAELEIESLLAQAVQSMQDAKDSKGAAVEQEFLSAAQRTLTERLVTMAWSDVQHVWPQICAAAQSPDVSPDFLRPVVEAALLLAARAHPAVAGEAALHLSQALADEGSDSVQNGGGEDMGSTIQSALSRLAKWVDSADEAQLSQCHGAAEPVDALLEKWRQHRPTCPIVKRMSQRRDTAAAR